MFTHKEQLLHQLEGAMSDLARQNTNEYRARYYAEARALLKSLVVIEWITEAEAEQWRADIHATHQQAIVQCQAAGESVDALVIEQAAFRLMHLAKVGIHPRMKVVAPVAQAARPALETLLADYHLGVDPVWHEGRWRWTAYKARLQEPTEWSHADDPRTAVVAAIAELLKAERV